MKAAKKAKIQRRSLIRRATWKRLKQQGIKFENFKQAAYDLAAAENLPVRASLSKTTVYDWLEEILHLPKAANISPAPPKPKPTPEPKLQPDYKAKAAEFYASWDWKRARYETLLAKGRKCQCCGASYATGAKIVVDHIKPLRCHWNLRLEPTNLQVLCDDCNMGKGAWDETRF